MDERNREMGRRIGTFFYFIYYNNLSFKLFTSLMPWFTLCNIDMGEVNHSTHFVENFVTSVYQVLLKRFQSFLENPLPCTGKLSPFAMLGDKGTIKHDITQPTLIRTLLLQKNNLFQKYFLSHPEVLSHTGENITELLLPSLKNVAARLMASI